MLTLQLPFGGGQPGVIEKLHLSNQEEFKDIELASQFSNPLVIPNETTNFPQESIVFPIPQINPMVDFAPIVPENTPTVLAFTHIVVATKGRNRKILLNDVSGKITGGLWAIMGASGSGKTTLLSTLSLRLDTKFMDIEGSFRLNGRAYSRSVLKAMSAYVMQDDLLHAEFTVGETLRYAAHLRMRDQNWTSDHRQQRIDELLKLLAIEHCKDTFIGDSRKKGISGGERKRVSVAIELLNRPKLLFLDEPTSGLDSSTAYMLCKALKNISINGECTTISTIHQPMPKIFQLFDNLILMKNGKIVYQGQTMKSILFLQTIGHPCPNNTNLADHLLDVISPMRKDMSAMDETAQTHQQVPVDLSMGSEKPFYSESPRNWFFEFDILFRRAMKQYIRRVDIILLNVLAVIIIAVCISFGFWFKIGSDQDTITKVLPSLFFAVVNQGVVGSLQTVANFPSERAIVLRERASGSYQVSSYFVAKTAVDFISSAWQPILLTCILYYSVGYQPQASKFFIYMTFLVLDTIAATSLAALVVCTCISIDRSTVVLCFAFEASRLFGGYYTSPALLQQYPEWKFADALSYIKYAYVGIALNELDGLNFDCNPGSVCKATTGGELIVNYGYDTYTIGSCFGFLILLIMGFRFLAYLGLKYLK